MELIKKNQYRRFLRMEAIKEVSQKKVGRLELIKRNPSRRFPRLEMIKETILIIRRAIISAMRAGQAATHRAQLAHMLMGRSGLLKTR